MSLLKKLPKPDQKSQNSQSISPFVWILFFGSILFWLGTVYITIGRPTLFPLELSISSEEKNIPYFLQLPLDRTEIWLPLVGVLGLSVLLRWVPPTNISRLAVRIVVLVLLVRYLVWRIIATVNLNNLIFLLLACLFCSVK